MHLTLTNQLSDTTESPNIAIHIVCICIGFKIWGKVRVRVPATPAESGYKNTEGPNATETNCLIREELLIYHSPLRGSAQCFFTEQMLCFPLKGKK